MKKKYVICYFIWRDYYLAVSLLFLYNLNFRLLCHDLVQRSGKSCGRKRKGRLVNVER